MCLPGCRRWRRGWTWKRCWPPTREAIIAGGTEAVWREWLARWRAWPRLRAVQRDNLFFIPADIVHRHGPRILQGAEAICAALEQARSRR